MAMSPGTVSVASDGTFTGSGAALALATAYAAAFPGDFAASGPSPTAAELSAIAAGKAGVCKLCNIVAQLIPYIVSHATIDASSLALASGVSAKVTAGNSLGLTLPSAFTAGGAIVGPRLDQPVTVAVTPGSTLSII